MLQDIAPHIYDNSYIPSEPKADDVFVDYTEKTILLREDQTFFHYSDIKDQITDWYWLFRIDDISYFLADLSKVRHIDKNRFELRYQNDPILLFAGITGWQIYHWRKQNRFCGVCGHETIDDTVERARICPHCGNVIYPRLNPAVIVGIINEKNEILVTKYAHGPYNHHALVAGFAEVGETIEQCVIREVKEETGLDVSNLVYYKSQPWPFSESLLFGFWCQAESTQEIHMQESELKLCEWKSQDNEIILPSDAALTAEMIHVFQKGDHKKWITIK